ncbi:hypothetical protein BC940DRAFT_320023 [Gongronella butleri]|nr:hypothetical protein BC940DRAFT_320023 [Gongronella butleri]
MRANKAMLRQFCKLPLAMDWAAFVRLASTPPLLSPPAPFGAHCVPPKSSAADQPAQIEESDDGFDSDAPTTPPSPNVYMSPIRRRARQVSLDDTNDDTEDEALRRQPRRRLQLESDDGDNEFSD